MSHILDGIIPAQMSVSQYRVTVIVFIGSENVLTSAYGHRMLRARTSLGVHDIIIIAFFIQMGTLRPGNLLHCPVPDIVYLPHQLHVFHIQFLNPDVIISVVFTAGGIGMGADIVALSVLVNRLFLLRNIADNGAQ